MKDFDKWNTIKKKVHAHNVSSVYFREREIWWARLGVNVGFEQDGTGEEYARPVVIIKKYNPHIFLVVPLSTTSKRGTYYFAVGNVDNKEAVAILSQIRLIDTHRLVKHIGMMDKSLCTELVRAIVKVNFGGWL